MERFNFRSWTLIGGSRKLSRASQIVWQLACAIVLAVGLLSVARGEGAVALQRVDDGMQQVVSRGVAYCSLVRLKRQSDVSLDGRLLLAFSEADGRGIVIYERDGVGGRWRFVDKVSRAIKGPSGPAPQWNPDLYVLRHKSGPLPAGTVLLAANSGRHQKHHGVHEDLELFASIDGGRTWKYRGSIAKGGTASHARYKTGVWEPDIREVGGKGLIVAYYSSQLRYTKGYNQLIAEKSSYDGGRTWSEASPIVAIPGGVERPGMPVVARMPNGEYVLSYEDVNGPNRGQVHLRFSKDGLHWGNPDERGVAVQTQSGKWPAGTPIVKWLPLRGPEGVVVVLAHHSGSTRDPDRTIYWNNNLGRGPWWQVPAPVQRGGGNNRAGWTQALLLQSNGELLQVTSSSSARAPSDPTANVILAGAKRLSFNRYEAEDAESQSAVDLRSRIASAGQYQEVPAAPYGKLSFSIYVGISGPKKILVRWKSVGLQTRPELYLDGHALEKGSNKNNMSKTRRKWDATSFYAKVSKGNHRIVVRGYPHAISVDYIEIVRQARPKRESHRP